LMSLVLPWWSGPMQRATLWKYEVRLVLYQHDLDWDDACHSSNVLGLGDMDCGTIIVVRMLAGLATLSALISFFTILNGLLMFTKRSSKSVKLCLAFGSWFAVLGAVCAIGAAAAAIQLREDIPANSLNSGVFCMFFASITGTVASTLLFCSGASCPRQKSSDDPGGGQAYVEKRSKAKQTPSPSSHVQIQQPQMTPQRHWQEIVPQPCGPLSPQPVFQEVSWYVRKDVTQDYPRPALPLPEVRIQLHIQS